MAGVECPENKPPEIGYTKHIFSDGKSAVIELNYSDQVVDNIPANGMRIKFTGKEELLFPEEK